MNSEDGSSLLDNFRVFSDRLLPHIVRLLPSCVHSLGAELDEDAITRNLVMSFGVAYTTRPSDSTSSAATIARLQKF